jgi:endonuclease/exonuclease/phosphatase family metal-dependent hydrolase
MPRIMIPNALIHHFEDVKSEVSATPEELKIMTYNIAYGGGLLNEEGRPESREFIENNLDLMMSQIKNENPDVLAVQEIDIYSNRSFGFDQMVLMAKECSFSYAAVAITWNKRWVPYPLTWNLKKQFGFVLAAQVVFSKYPITNQDVTTLIKPINKPFWYNWFYLDRVFQNVTIDVAGNQLKVANVHLEAFDKETRLSQVRTLLDDKKINSDNLDIIVGDFNSIHSEWSIKTSFEDEPDISFDGDNSIAMILKESGLKDIFSSKRLSSNKESFFTFPSNNPTRQLDYMFINTSSLSVKDVRILKSKDDISDHLPIVSTLKIL